MPNTEKVRRYGRPCAAFVTPRDGLYASYCDRCGFSQGAHDWWDDVPSNDSFEAP